MYVRVLGMINVMSYASVCVCVCVCVCVNLECNVEHAFNEIKM